MILAAIFLLTMAGICGIAWLMCWVWGSSDLPAPDDHPETPADDSWWDTRPISLDQYRKRKS